MKGFLFFVVALLFCTAIVSSAMEMDIEEDNQGLSSALLMASPADEETLLSVESPISGVKEGPDFIKGVHFIELEENSRAETEAHVQNVQNVLLLLDSENEDLKTVTRKLPLTLVQLKSKGGYEQAKGILEIIAKMQQAIVDDDAKDLKNMDDLVRFNCKQNQQIITEATAKLTQRKTDQEAKLVSDRSGIETNTKAVADLDASAAVLLKANDEIAAQRVALVDKNKTTQLQRIVDRDILYQGMRMVCVGSDISDSDLCVNSGFDKLRLKSETNLQRPPTTFQRVSSALDAYQSDPTIWKKLSAATAAAQTAAGGNPEPQGLPAPSSEAQDVSFGPPRLADSEATSSYRTPEVSQMSNLSEMLLQMQGIPPAGDPAYKKLGDDLDACLICSPDKLKPMYIQANEYIAGMIAADEADQSSLNEKIQELEEKVLGNLTKITDAWKQQAVLQVTITSLQSAIGFDQADILQTLDEIKQQTILLDLEKLRCSTEEQNLLVRQSRRVVQTNNLAQLASLIRVLGDSKLPKCTNDCTALAQGRCNWKGVMGVDSFCVCSDAFFGADCSLKKCAGFLLPAGASPDTIIAQQMDTVTSSVLGPAAGAVKDAVKYFQADHKLACSGRGTCNTQYGWCSCNMGYFNGTSGACENTSCPQANATDPLCGGPIRGQCMAFMGLCICNMNYYGKYCEKSKCGGTSNQLYEPEQLYGVCNTRGTCNDGTTTDGTCKCSTGFYGKACELRQCPSDCSGNGICNGDNGRCTCNAGFAGLDCKSKSCPSDCSGHGICNPVTGKCTCRQGFSGKTCLPVNNCSRSEANWTTSFDSAGWSFCPEGSLLRGFWKNTCHGIFCLEFAACSKPCEGGEDALAITGCYNKVDWSSTWVTAGETRCNDNSFMAALSRGSGQLLDSINMAQCCYIVGAIWDGCKELSWNMRSSGWSLAEEGSWLSGLTRTGDKSDGDNNDLRNITKALSCSFVRLGL